MAAERAPISMAGAMTESTRILLIGENCLSRCGLEALLRNAGFVVASADAPPTEMRALALEPGEAGVVVWDLSSGPVDSVSFSVAVENLLTKARVMLILGNKVDPRLVRNAASRLDGVIHSHANTEEFLNVLNLIIAGTRVFTGIAVDRLLMGDPDFGALSTSDEGRGPIGSGLSQREVQVAKLVASGMSNKEIARHLDLAEGTVKVHLRRISKRLDFANRSQMAAWATRHLAGATVVDARRAFGRWSGDCRA